MKTYFLNPTLDNKAAYIREGRCMQKASSWATAWPPITLGVMAAIAKKKGDVRLFDGNVEKQSLAGLLQDIKKFCPDIVVVNTGFPSIDDDMFVAKSIKESIPDTIIIGFGVYFTLLESKGFEEYPYLDFAINGEPEDTFDELLGFLDEKRADFENILGLIYNSGDGIKTNSSRPLLNDLDRLPFPDRSLFKNDCYRLPHNNKTFTLINVARGCPYPCTYCIVAPYYGKKVRKHSVDYVIREIQENKNVYGIEEFLFWEEAFTIDREYALKICKAIIDNNLNIKWAATTRVDLVDEELLKSMKNAGCYLLGLGIESGNQHILDNAKKQQTIEDIKKAVEICKRVKLKSMGHFIFGLPGETKETAEKTIKFMLDLDLDFVQSYCAVPYPKTEFGELAKRNSWIKADKWSQYNFGGNSIVDNGSLKPKDVTYYRQKAFRKFYFRPFYIFNKIIKEFSLEQLPAISKFTDWLKPGKK